VTTIRNREIFFRLMPAGRKAAIDQQYRWQPRPGSQAHPGIAKSSTSTKRSLPMEPASQKASLDIKAVLGKPSESCRG